MSASSQASVKTIVTAETRSGQVLDHELERGVAEAGEQSPPSPRTAESSTPSPSSDGARITASPARAIASAG